MKPKSLVLLLCCLALVQSQDDYEDPSVTDNGERCQDIDEFCRGDYQSPIDLRTQKAITTIDTIRLRLVRYNLNPTEVTVTNDGCSAIYRFKYESNQKFIARNGTLGRTNYEFVRLQFHWGETSDRGSEHVTNGRRYSMEMQLVFFNQKYDSFQDARAYTDGLAVLSIFFNSSTAERDYGWIKALNQVRRAGTTYTLPDPTVFNIYDLIGANRYPYFTYFGSLTTRPCSQAVTWIVHTVALPITERQLNVFRSLRKFNRMILVDNYRPLQNATRRKLTLVTRTTQTD
ncbi:carbonic anhydrase 2-like [Topomyia yanbarensis]|uniref:carbonic anhydrase 2-like n=1 Tax=Topomyia yanbarensis TaxID=2498891 RepID=UPI00273B0769|nr:carbonic anhydrase 2-like [Topomyia yanbarensis]